MENPNKTINDLRMQIEFLNNHIQDLKSELAEMADRKAAQRAMNIQKDKTIQQLTNHLDELEQKYLKSDEVNENGSN